MAERVVFIEDAGRCVVSNAVLDGSAPLKWMVRDEPRVPTDTGWRFFSAADSRADLSDAEKLSVVDFNDVCAAEPAVIGIWGFPVGSDLQIVVEGGRKKVVDTPTGRELDEIELYRPGGTPAVLKVDRRDAPGGTDAPA